MTEKIGDKKSNSISENEASGMRFQSRDAEILQAIYTTMACWPGVSCRSYFGQA